jgi:radical SAM protein with 4Fe4S-binding SPASM domain
MNLERAKDYLRQRVSPGESYDDLLDFPRFFEIETVNACNARCPMCTIDDWQRDSPTMKDDLFQKIADEVCARADVVKRVSLYRDGEPLLDKKMAKRVKILKDGGIRKVGISTNVQLLNEKTSIALLEAGLDEIVLSLDSLKKDVFESIRVRLNFETVMENALRFIALRNKIRPQTSIWARMIRQESNQDEWPAFRDYWQPKLAENDRCYYLNIHNWGGQLEGFKPIEQSYQPKVPCVALWSLMVIFANGDVPMCNVDYNNKHGLGEVRTRSIAELWNGGEQNERRRKHLSGRKGENDLCANCTVWNDPSDRANVSEAFVAVME